jgi:hypothetical protein
MPFRGDLHLSNIGFAGLNVNADSIGQARSAAAAVHCISGLL